MDAPTENILKFLKRDPKRKARDSRFEQLRDEICELLQNLQSDPTNSELIDKANRLLLELDQFDKDTTTGYTFERAKTNEVVFTQRMRRTHYAAYMAGQFSASDDIADKFKCWMHNAASYGAISLAEALDSFLVNKRSSQQLELLKVFRNGALEDAARFLSLSRRYDETSVLTAYNSAKLDVLSKDPALRTLGIQHLTNLTPPASDCHPAEISWHINNYEAFTKQDEGLRKIIRVHDADKLEVIAKVLENNSKAAQAIKARRGDIWKPQTEYNKALLSTFISGLVVITLLAGNPQLAKDISDFLVRGTEAVWSLSSTSVPSIESSPVQRADASLSMQGDGGLARPLTIRANDLVRSVFGGDGGFA